MSKVGAHNYFKIHMLYPMEMIPTFASHPCGLNHNRQMHSKSGHDIEPYTGIFQNKIKRLLNTALSQCHHSFSMILSILIVALIAASVWSASRARVRNGLSLYIHVMLVCTRASVRPPGGMLT